MEEELVQISVNYDGQDVMLTVDLQTANILLNDPHEARLYVERALNVNENPSDETDQNDSNDNLSVWSSKRKASERDQEATAFFLKLREKAASKFNDKKTAKMQLWQTIANTLNENGYLVGNGKDGAEKCRQKFTNMQKQYYMHIKHMKCTGEKKKDPPPFFEDLHSILGSKDKTNPQNLQDSMDEDVENKTIDVNAPGPSEASQIKNRFQNMAKTIRPTSVNTQLMNLMKRQHEEDREDREKHFRSLHDLLQEQNEQRSRMLDIFERMAEKKSLDGQSLSLINVNHLNILQF